MKKKKIIIMCVILVPIVCISVVAGLLLNEIFGNPVSKFLVKRSVSEYLEENYSDTDFIIKKVGYDFKNMNYYVKIVSASASDEYFYIYADSVGQNIDDDYRIYFNEDGVYFDDYQEIEEVTEFNAEEIYSDTEPLEEATEFNAEKNTFSITKDTSECDNVFFIEDDWFSESSGTMVEDDFGIAFTDSSNGISKTIATVKVKYCEDIHGEDAISAEIIGRNKNSLLIEVYIGVLYKYSFLYNVDTNEFIKLQPNGEWYIYENMIIGKTSALAVDEQVELYAYNWDGELLYSKGKILVTTGVSDNWLYFTKMSEGETETDFTVYKMQLDGTHQTEHYSVTLPRFSYIIILDDSKIILYNYDTEEQTEIDLFTLQPVK